MVFVVAIAAMLVTPLPTFLLDILLVLNISFSVLLLLIGLYLPNSLALLSFPTILLLSTLFRLGLNVAATRLVLSQGDAGTVIEAFGTFLIRGEILVGVIIFLIITIVNFIVISRGASRVSEVAARFTLEAIPGKQTTIDSDYKAGAISAEEARQKRDELSRETQLYASMDGAMKFVQGDAVAGLFIIATNILGGIYLGISRGQSVVDAAHTYTTLTIGDGLVSQIPALLTSICAGIIVTRVASSEGATLSSDLGGQLFSQPSALFVTGIIIISLALLAGLPILPFSVVGIGAVIGAATILRTKKERALAPMGRGEFASGALPAPSGHSRDEEGSDSDLLAIHLDASVSFRNYRLNVQKYRTAWQEIRSQILSDLGIRLPDVVLVQDELAAAGLFSVEWNKTVIVRGSTVIDGAFVEINPNQALCLGLEVLEEAEHPITGQRVFWALDTPALRRVAEAGNIPVYDFFEFIGLQIVAFCLRNPQEFLSVTDVYGALRQLEKKHPGLIAEGFGKGFLSVPKLTEVLQELVRDGLGVRDFRGISESVAAYCSSLGVSVDDETSVDVDEVVSFVRAARRRHVLSRYLGPRDALQVITLSPEVEAAFDAVSIESRNMPLPLEPEVFDELQRTFVPLMKGIREQGVGPLAVLCRGDLRAKVVRFVRGLSPHPAVLALEEIDPGLGVEQIGVWRLS